MDVVETKVWKEPWDVDRRLTEIGLRRDGLLRVVIEALSSAADATPFHPANAAGTFAYQSGTWALRDAFVGDAWQVDRSDAVEAIKNDALKIKIIFANVDLACDDDQPPKARSRKGAGAERACSGNLFGYLPQYAAKPMAGWATYYLMVDADGAAELSRTVIKGSNFDTPIERIYLSGGMKFDGEGLSLDEGDVAEDFDPQVARK